jgi:hypothetical protein
MRTFNVIRLTMVLIAYAILIILASSCSNSTSPIEWNRDEAITGYWTGPLPLDLPGETILFRPEGDWECLNHHDGKWETLRGQLRLTWGRDTRDTVGWYSVRGDTLEVLGATLTR